MSTARKLGQLYRPQGPKAIAVGNAWSKGSTITLNNQVDLSVPVIGFRFILSGRIAITTAAYTSVKPEQLLGLIKQLTILGNNIRQKGQITVFQSDLASWLGFRSLLNKVPFQYLTSKASGALTQAPFPTSPYSLGTGFDGTVNTFDFRITFDVPLYPERSGKAYIPGWAMRSREWGNTIQISAQMASLADNAENEIGVSAATSVTTLSSFGSGAGSPTLDVYSLTNIAGIENDAAMIPGVLSRVSSPMVVNASGVNIALVQNLQKQNTGRVFMKSGVSTLFPAFSSLSDTLITSTGVTVAQNRAVRNLLDWFSHKYELSNEYGTQPIQGYNCFDFLQSDNPFSAYPGASADDGTTFQLVGNVTTVANAAGIYVQEQHLYEPSGALYDAA